MRVHLVIAIKRQKVVYRLIIYHIWLKRITMFLFDVTRLSGKELASP